MNSTSVSITEVFGSVQGESSTTGWPTTFIRLAGCPLRCVWCDTPYSFPKGEKVAIARLVEMAQEHGLPYVCVTGGEPLVQKGVLALMRQLCDAGFVVSVETSGAYPINGVDERVRVVLDVKCPGSQMEHKNHWPNLSKLKKDDEVKFVINDRDDYVYAKEICAKHGLFSLPITVLFSPVYGALEARTLVEWILEERLPVRLNLQVHKMIWSPTTRGV